MNLVNVDECLTALSSVIGNTDRFIGLHEPTFQGNEWAYVKSCLDSGWVSSVGEYVNRFEKMLSDYTGMPHCSVTTNGTSALHVCLILMGVQQNDEVLIPALTFVATANAVSYCNAIPHFIDTCDLTMGVDVEKLAHYLSEIAEIKNNVCINKFSQRPIRAVVVVHAFGHPVDMAPLQALCKKYHLKLIEDAAEALGSYYHGTHVGHFSDVMAFSFNGNKILTTGGGGAVLTADGFLAKRAKHITTTAKVTHAWEFMHDEVGYNYRLPNINAALGCAQLEQLPKFVDYKRNLCQKYIEAFKNIPYAEIFKEADFAKSNYWLNVLILKKPDRDFIEAFIGQAHEHNYGLRGLWKPLDQLPMYQHCPKMDLSHTHEMYDRIIALPSSVLLGEKNFQGV